MKSLTDPYLELLINFEDQIYEIFSYHKAVVN